MAGCMGRTHVHHYTSIGRTPNKKNVPTYSRQIKRLIDLHTIHEAGIYCTSENALHVHDRSCESCSHIAGATRYINTQLQCRVYML